MVKVATLVSLAALALGPAATASAETFIEQNAEFRMQLDFAVPDAALRKFLPAGWEPSVATQGPAKDCNLRLIFIDRIDITDEKGQPKGSSALVYLAAPAKQTGTSNAGQMIIGGLTTDPKDVPGPFGNYQLAAASKMDRSVAGGDGKPTLMQENWEFTAADGVHFEIHVKYERASARRNPAQEVKFFDPRNPSAHQIFKIESGLDIMRNATVPIKDRVMEFSYKAGGGSLGPLFDGSEKVVSIDSFHWYNRGVYAP